MRDHEDKEPIIRVLERQFTGPNAASYARRLRFSRLIVVEAETPEDAFRRVYGQESLYGGQFKDAFILQHLSWGNSLFQPLNFNN
jgi:hypothetical protein